MEHPGVPLRRITDHRNDGHGRIKQHVASPRQPGAWSCARWLGAGSTSHSHHEDRAAPYREDDTFHSISPRVIGADIDKGVSLTPSMVHCILLAVWLGVCAYVDGAAVTNAPIGGVGALFWTAVTEKRSGRHLEPDDPLDKRGDGIVRQLCEKALVDHITKLVVHEAGVDRRVLMPKSETVPRSRGLLALTTSILRSRADSNRRYRTIAGLVIEGDLRPR
jgi:hypothetical protein